MKRLTFGLWLIAIVTALLAAPVVQAKLLYEETVTIILEDGTSVYLVLDDHGMSRPPTSGQARVHRAKFDYLDKTAAERQKRRPGPPYTVAAPPPASAAQRQREERLSGGRGDLSNKFAGMRDHSKGRYLWPLKSATEKHYYYLPPPPRVAVDADGTPQFLFMKFTSDRDKEHGGVSGGILHFLCEYGLTAEQEAELAEKLEEKVSGAKVMGAVHMESGEGESTFRIISATMSEGGFAQSIVASGKAPLLPGQKVAAAARLDAAGAVLIEESLKRPTSDISVEFDLAYTAFLPAFDGEITFDWDYFKSHIDEWQRSSTHNVTHRWKHWKGWQTTNTYTEDELRLVYDSLCESEVIQIEWTESIVDERLEAIRMAFFRFMETSFFETEQLTMPEDEEEDDEDLSTPQSRGNRDRFTRFVAKGEEAFKNKTIKMKTTLPVKVSHVAVGNISGAWYREARKGHPELFAEVNVDDPFFQQRQVAFTLDLDAIEVFDKAINFVTVEVRKKRQSNRDFHTSFTLTKDSIAQSGTTRMVTYAKMRDESPEAFDYLVRWSLRGGVEWPTNPSWIRGEWEGVTLAPPILPLRVEAEADLEDLAELEMTRATVEVRFTQFGKQVTDNRSLYLSVKEGNPLASMMIFRDRNNSNWEYRVNFYHKKLGRQQGGWTRGGEDGYVYCAVPEKVRGLDELRDRLTDALTD